jgi:hypothetical protein
MSNTRSNMMRNAREQKAPELRQAEALERIAELLTQIYAELKIRRQS